jgi:hypothetical protein
MSHRWNICTRFNLDWPHIALTSYAHVHQVWYNVSKTSLRVQHILSGQRVCSWWFWFLSYCNV